MSTIPSLPSSIIPFGKHSSFYNFLTGEPDKFDPSKAHFGLLPDEQPALRKFIFQNDLPVLGFNPQTGELTDLTDQPDVIPFFQITVTGQNLSLFHWRLWTDGIHWVSDKLDAPPARKCVEAILFHREEIEASSHRQWAIWEENGKLRLMPHSARYFRGNRNQLI